MSLRTRYFSSFFRRHANVWQGPRLDDTGTTLSIPTIIFTRKPLLKSADALRQAPRKHLAPTPVPGCSTAVPWRDIILECKVLKQQENLSRTPQRIISTATWLEKNRTIDDVVIDMSILDHICRESRRAYVLTGRSGSRRHNLARPGLV